MGEPDADLEQGRRIEDLERQGVLDRESIEVLERQGVLDRESIEVLERQGEADRESIRELEGQGDLDRQTISDLRAQADVDHALIARLEAEGEVDRDKIANLETALITARRIGAAMGVLMNSHKITDAQAFELLVQASQHTHHKLRDIADDVVLTGTLPKV